MDFKGLSTSAGYPKVSRILAARPARPSGSATEEHLRDSLIRICLFEEIESFLDFHHQEIGDGFQQRLNHVGFRSIAGLSQLQVLSFLKRELKFLLENVRILIAPHRNIANEERNSAFRNIDIHQRSADIQQRTTAAASTE